MKAILVTASLALIMVTGCGDDSGPGTPTPPVDPTDTLHILAVSPEGGTVDQLWPIVDVQADVELDPISIVLGAVTLSESGTVLTPVFTLLGDRRAFTMDVAMLPQQAYVLHLGTSLRGIAGETLAPAQTFTFSTRAPRVADILPGSPQLRQWIAVDAQNGRHVLNVDPAGGSITYGTCRAIDCGAAGAWQSAVIESGPLSPMATGSLTVDAQGRVHATYPMLSTTTLRYATCASDCSVAANWTRADVDTSANPGLWSAIRSDASGRLHIVYSDWGSGGARYATCAGACATIDDWVSIALPVSLDSVQDIDLAVAGSGRLSLILRGQATNYPVQVAECAAVCLSAAEWHVVTLLDSSLPSLGNAIAVDADGVRHVAFQTTSSEVVYATCVRDCSDDAGWQRVTLAMAASGASPGIATARGRLAIVAGPAQLATCRVGCTVASNWRTKRLGSASATSSHPRVAMSPAGQPLMVTGISGTQYLE